MDRFTLPGLACSYADADQLAANLTLGTTLVVFRGLGGGVCWLGCYYCRLWWVGTLSWDAPTTCRECLLKRNLAIRPPGDLQGDQMPDLVETSSLAW